MLRVAFFAALTVELADRGGARLAGPPPLPSAYVSLEVETVADETGGAVPRYVRNAITRQLKKSLSDSGFTVARKPAAQADLKSSILSCGSAPSNRADAFPGSAESNCIVTAVITDNETDNIVTKLVVNTPGFAEATAVSGQTGTGAAAIGRTIADQIAHLIGPAQAAATGPAVSEDITAGGAHVVYQGNGIFVVGPPRTAWNGGAQTTVVDLKHIRHSYDPAIDKDVPYYTNVTLNDRVPPLVDGRGREYARITLYHINPPLMGLASKEFGIDRGIDFRDPADLVKSAYSNYLSPVVTNDKERRPVSGHPIGHFYVKVEIPTYPTVLSGMTTIQRADTELTDQTIKRELGIGGVLLTPQPGRLNSATEALEELTLRQRELRVVDGLYYRRVGSKNVGPEYIQTDGNVAFARFLVPVRNAKDAMAYFVEFMARGEHNIFGSLINRPNKGTGSGCTPFAISWLEASNAIPFVAEPAVTSSAGHPAPESFGTTDFWKYLLRRIDIPWHDIGCDDRLGVDRVIPADYTIYDLLFHHLSRKFIEAASEGLAQKIKNEYGVLTGTLFQFGALTPIRDLVIHSRRKDPDDIGDYSWAPDGKGLAAAYWDNSRFSDWIKQLWTRGPSKANIGLVREGRFRGIEIDDLAIARQQEPFFAEADRIAQEKRRLEASGVRPSTCQELFSLGIQ